MHSRRKSKRSFEISKDLRADLSILTFHKWGKRSADKELAYTEDRVGTTIKSPPSIQPMFILIDPSL